MIEYYPQISHHFQLEYKSYVSMITNSLEIASLFSEAKHQKNASIGTQTDEKCDFYYYNIIYDSYKVFMFIIENSKSQPFSEMKEYMSKILKEFEKIYSSYLDTSKEIEYHIFYLFMITQILKFLNKNKSYDVKYEEFYKKVFGEGEIKKRTSSCLKLLLTNQNHLTDNFQMGDRKATERTTPGGEDQNEDGKAEQIFFINFLSIYIIYINELISLKQIKDSRDRDRKDFKFDNLREKIDKYLTLTNDEDISRSNDHTKLFKKFLTKKFNKQNNFLFEIILLKSILYYKYEKGLIEINIPLTDEMNNENYYYIYYEMEILDLLILEIIEKQLNFDNRICDFCKLFTLISFNIIIFSYK